MRVRGRDRPDPARRDRVECHRPAHLVHRPRPDRRRRAAGPRPGRGAAPAGRSSAVLCSPRMRALPHRRTGRADRDRGRRRPGRVELRRVRGPDHAPRSTRTTRTGHCGRTAAPAGESPDAGAASGSTGCWLGSRRCWPTATSRWSATATRCACVGARWIGLPAGGGGLLRLDTATLSGLGHEHDRPVIRATGTSGTADRAGAQPGDLRRPALVRRGQHDGGPGGHVGRRCGSPAAAAPGRPGWPPVPAAGRSRPRRPSSTPRSRPGRPAGRARRRPGDGSSGRIATNAVSGRSSAA